MKVCRIIKSIILMIVVMQAAIFADGWRQTEFGN